MALDFLNAGDQVDHGDIAAIDGAATLTWMGWVKADSTSAVPGFTKGNLYLLYESSGKFAAGESGAWEKSSTTGITSDTWTHVAVTYDGRQAAADRIKIYLGGSLETMTGTNPGTTFPSSASSLLTGQNATGTGPGRMAHARIWTAVLSAGEIASERDDARAVRTAGLILDVPYDGDVATDLSGAGNHGTVTGATFTTLDGPAVSGEVVAAGGAYTLTGGDVEFELASQTTGGLVFDYVLAQESSEAIWPSRMTQLADWAVPVYLNGERVIVYTKSGSNQIWVMGNDTTGTLVSYIDLPWMSRLDDTKVTKWLGLVASYASTVAVDVYVRYANNPGEFDAATWTLRGTLPANPTIVEGARIGLGGSTRWLQVRFRAETIAGGGFELFPPVHIVPIDTMRSPN